MFGRCGGSLPSSSPSPSCLQTGYVGREVGWAVGHVCAGIHARTEMGGLRSALGMVRWSYVRGPEALTLKVNWTI